jgi:hypothetical protein
MKYFKILSYFISICLLLIIFIFLIINLNLLGVKSKIYENYPNFELRKYVFNRKSVIEHFKNDYNVKFLPFTEFEKFGFKTKKINFSKEYFENKVKFKETTSYKRYGTFFIDFHIDKLILTDYLGNIYFQKNFSKVIDGNEEININKISSNLNADRVFDSYIYKDKLFVSFTKKINNCSLINVMYAPINEDSLIFQNFFNPRICSETGSPGKMQYLKFNNQDGLLLSTSEGVSDKPGFNTQNPNSIFGKILFIPFNLKSEISIFSMGHRVIQGLNVINNKVIATEHGPRAGDEINYIINKKNYGWPLASFGERYDFMYSNEKLTYNKNHHANNFKEPIFSFIPGIGISEIIKIPNNFSIHYNNHYVLASLNGRSLYFIRFDKDFNKLFTIEKVFINQRIRDLKYYKQKNSIIMALEEKGELGILTN